MNVVGSVFSITGIALYAKDVADAPATNMCDWGFFRVRVYGINCDYMANFAQVSLPLKEKAGFMLYFSYCQQTPKLHLSIYCSRTVHVGLLQHLPHCVPSESLILRVTFKSLNQTEFLLFFYFFRICWQPWTSLWSSWLFCSSVSASALLFWPSRLWSTGRRKRYEPQRQNVHIFFRNVKHSFSSTSSNNSCSSRNPHGRSHHSRLCLSVGQVLNVVFILHFDLKWTG